MGLFSWLKKKLDSTELSIEEVVRDKESKVLNIVSLAKKDIFELKDDVAIKATLEWEKAVTFAKSVEGKELIALENISKKIKEVRTDFKSDVIKDIVANLNLIENSIDTHINKAKARLGQ